CADKWELPSQRIFYFSNSLPNRVARKPVYQTNPQRFLSRDLLRQKEHLQSASFADQSRQALCAAPAGDQAQRGAAMSENGAGCCDSISAGKGQVHASSHAVATNGGDHRDRKAIEQVGEFLAKPCERKCLRTREPGNFVQISSSGKEPVITRNNQRTDCATFRFNSEPGNAGGQRGDYCK